MGEKYVGPSKSTDDDEIISLIGVNPNIKPSLLYALAVMKDNEEIAFIDSSYKTTAMGNDRNCLGMFEGLL